MRKSSTHRRMIIGSSEFHLANKKQNYLRMKYTIRIGKIIFYTFLILLAYSCQQLKNNDEVIAILDMRYTLRGDMTKQQDIDKVWDHMHAIATLQGVVNRESPHLFIRFVENRGVCIDDYWWNKYRKQGEWLANRDTLVLSNILDAITYYKDKINGAVVYDPNVASTSNVASSIAGIENLVAIRYDPSPGSLYSQVVLGGPKLPVKERLINEDGTAMFTGKGTLPGTQISSSGSIKNDPYLWFIEKYMKQGRCNSEFAAYYIDQQWRKNPTAANINHHTLSNHDFFVSKKAFFFDLSPWGDEPATDDLNQPIGTDLNTLKSFLLQAYKQNKGKKMCYIGGFPSWAFKYTNARQANGLHGAVPTEWEYSKIISAYNAFMDADAIGFGALANASFWQHFPLQKEYKQRRVTTEELKQRGYLNEKGKVDFKGRKFFIFYVGDYDAASWVSQTAPGIWDDPNRGKVPLMWCISPVLQERVPMALHYQRMTATGNDYFAAADNGAGYLNPGMLQEPREISGLPSGLNTWAEHCKKYYKTWDITITGFVIDGYAPGLNKDGLNCYESFSPNGIVPQKVPLTLLHGQMPILRPDLGGNPNDPAEAAKIIVSRIKQRPIPFHWFRNILKTPSWYMNVVNEIKKLDPTVELLDAPTFFELYRTWLRQNPDAANGKIKGNRNTSE